MQVQQKKKRKKYLNALKCDIKWAGDFRQLVYDKSCVNKSTTNEYNEASRDEAEKLVREFFTATLIK